MFNLYFNIGPKNHLRWSANLFYAKHATPVTTYIPNIGVAEELHDAKQPIGYPLVLLEPYSMSTSPDW